MNKTESHAKTPDVAHAASVVTQGGILFVFQQQRSKSLEKLLEWVIPNMKSIISIIIYFLMDKEFIQKQSHSCLLKERNSN